MESKFYKNQIDYLELPDDAFILDVRNGAEHTEISLRRKHYFVELPNFDAKEFIEKYKPNGERIYVMCKSGVRASKAAEKLEKAGYENVAIIRGGISSLYGKDELVCENKKMSMERQVRIVAGSLVLIGSILALFVNIYFALLPAFVGCGLMYAGISNTCAMATLLGKLPWNK